MTEEAERADLVIFQALANELPDEDPEKTATKLKRRLKRAQLPYDRPHINRIRSLHEALRNEISRMQDSKYYCGSANRFAAPEDFDTKRMVRVYGSKYPEISASDLERIIGFAVYVYYLR